MSLEGVSDNAYLEAIDASIDRQVKEAKRPDPDALAASVLSEMVGAMAIARAVSNNERSEQILKATRDSIKARIGLAA